MANNKLDFAKSLNLGSDWKEDGDKVVISFTNSDDFSEACIKIDNASFSEELDDESNIDLFGANFSWVGYGSNDEVYHIMGIANFNTDVYRIEIQ